MPENHEKPHMRRGDDLINYRLDKLEESIRKLAENQEILVRIELQSIESNKAIQELFRQSSECVEWREDKATEITTLSTKVGFHSAILSGLGAIVALLLLTKVFDLI